MAHRWSHLHLLVLVFAVFAPAGGTGLNGTGPFQIHPAANITECLFYDNYVIPANLPLRVGPCSATDQNALWQITPNGTRYFLSCLADICTNLNIGLVQIPDKRLVLIMATANGHDFNQYWEFTETSPGKCEVSCRGLPGALLTTNPLDASFAGAVLENYTTAAPNESTWIVAPWTSTLNLTASAPPAEGLPSTLPLILGLCIGIGIPILAGSGWIIYRKCRGERLFPFGRFKANLHPKPSSESLASLDLPANLRPASPSLVATSARGVPQDRLLEASLVSDSTLAGPSQLLPPNATVQRTKDSPVSVSSKDHGTVAGTRSSGASRESMGNKTPVLFLGPGKGAEEVTAMAILDSQASSGNWICKDIVKALKKDLEMDTSESGEFITFDGRPIVPLGKVFLTFRFSRGLTFHRDQPFFVYDSSEWEVVLGWDFISKKEIMLKNERALVAPVGPHRPIGQREERAGRRNTREKRDAKAARLKEEHIKKQQQQQQQQQQDQQQQGQQQQQQ
ncbi:hypothetical protein GQ53DRAFT_832440 [Thozetella sp. PMI_491]|nr:hypothetical protein GQ53DRAFT_832440 [Thozetella sp. PMI_491]